MLPVSLSCRVKLEQSLPMELCKKSKNTPRSRMQPAPRGSFVISVLPIGGGSRARTPSTRCVSRLPEPSAGLLTTRISELCRSGS